MVPYKLIIEITNKEEKLEELERDNSKEEIVNIARKKRDSGKDSFDLIPEKANKLHDDRFYCVCMCAYGLQEKRRENITARRSHGNVNEILSKLVVSNGKHIDKIFG